MYIIHNYIIYIHVHNRTHIYILIYIDMQQRFLKQCSSDTEFGSPGLVDFLRAVAWSVMIGATIQRYFCYNPIPLGYLIRNMPIDPILWSQWCGSSLHPPWFPMVSGGLILLYYTPIPLIQGWNATSSQERRWWTELLGHLAKTGGQRWRVARCRLFLSHEWVIVVDKSCMLTFR